jgi:hypothetical protein
LTSSASRFGPGSAAWTKDPNAANEEAIAMNIPLMVTLASGPIQLIDWLGESERLRQTSPKNYDK